MGITREQYEAAIPKCCAYQTIEAHENILLCWGLARAVERGETVNCDHCDENTMNPARCHVCGAHFCSPKNSERDAVVTVEEADELANQIRAELTPNVELTCARAQEAPKPGRRRTI